MTDSAIIALAAIKKIACCRIVAVLHGIRPCPARTLQKSVTVHALSHITKLIFCGRPGIGDL